MKKVLVATDLSARSDRAIQRALLLAAPFSADVLVLHVVDEDLPPAVAGPMKIEAEAALAALLAESGGPGKPCASSRVVVGRQFETILAVAESEAVDLVAIGRHRADAVLDLFRGSTGERVIRFGKTPVLVVKQPADAPYRRIMVAVDFSAPARRALEAALRFFPDAEFYLLHAFDLSVRELTGTAPATGRAAEMREDRAVAFEQSQMDEFLAGLPAPLPRLHPLIKEGRPVHAILQAAEENRPDLIVLGTHGRTGVGRLLLGSVAERVLAEASIDVLAVRAQE